MTHPARAVCPCARCHGIRAERLRHRNMLAGLAAVLALLTFLALFGVVWPWQ